MTKLAFLAVMLFAVAASAAGAPARATDVRPCPTPPLTVAELLVLADDAGYAGFAGQLNPNGLACYEGADVTVVGFVREPEGLGGTSATVIQPTWMTEWGLYLYGSSRARDGDPTAGSYVVAYPPDAGDPNRRYDGRWVSLEAHFDDPAAQTCHAEGPADADTPSDAEAVAMCRQILVLSSIRVTSAPDSATGPLAPSPRDGAPTIILVAAGLGAVAWLLRPSRRIRESKRPGR